MFEFEKKHICVDRDFDVEDGIVTAYLETWFDVDEKFGTHTSDRDDEWLNLYAKYTPKTGDFSMFYIISNDDSESDEIAYLPTEKEKELIIGMMEKVCMDENGTTLADYVEHIDDDISMGGVS